MLSGAAQRGLLGVREERGRPPQRRGLTSSGNLLPMFSSSLSASAVAHEHLKERGLFGLPPPPPGANPTDYYHQMTLMAGHPNPYGDILMQSGGAAGTAHLHEYLSPVDGE